MFFVFTTNNIFAQTGTVRSNDPGNWNSAATWEPVNINRSGTISINNGSNVVTGNGTLFLTELTVGSIISRYTGFFFGWTTVGTVASITSNTSLTLTSNVATNANNQSLRTIGGPPSPVDDVIIAGNHIVNVNGEYICANLNIGTSNGNVAGLNFSNSTSQLIVNGAFTLGGNNTNRLGLLDMTNGGTLIVNSLNLGNTSPSNTFNPGSGTIQLKSTNTIPSTIFRTFNNLNLSSGTTTFGAGITVNGDLSINSGATVTINATGSRANTLTLAGNSQNSGTWGGTGTGAGNIQTTYFNTPATSPTSKFVTITNSLCTTGYWIGTFSSDWNTSSNWCGNNRPDNTTDVVIPAGTPNQPIIGASTTASARNLTINNGATLTLNSNTTSLLNISGDFTNNGTFTASGTSSIVTFNGASSALIQGSSATTFSNLIINKDAAATTITNSATAKAFTVNGNLTITRGNLILSATDNNYTVSNNLTVASGSTITHNVDWDTNRLLSVGGNIAIDGAYSKGLAPRSHVQMTGSGKTIHTGTSALNILTLYTNGAITVDGDLTVNDNFWAFYNAGGTFTIPATFTVTAKQTMLSAGGSVIINGGNLKVSGGLAIGYSGLNGSVTLNSGTLDADSVNIGDGTRTGTFSHTGGTANIGNLTINPAAGNAYNCTNSPALNISGTWANGGTFVRATSTVAFNRSGDQAVPNFTYYNLAFSGSGTKTLAVATTVNNFSIGTGVMANLGTGLVHTASSLTLSGLAAASGSWGSTTSAATNKSNTYFSPVTGIINVSTSTCITPTLYAMTGAGGSFCATDTGSAIGLANSQTGVSYQLLRGTVAVGSPVLGTGAAISFGTTFKTTGAYTVLATNTITFCAVKMTGTVNITAYTTPALPTATVTDVSCPSDATGAITITSTAAPAALKFATSSNQVADLNTTLLNGRSAFTVEGWIKFDKTKYVERMALFGQNDVVEIAFEGNNLRCWTPNGGSIDLPLTSYPSDNNWHHIAVTGSGTQLVIYLDGVSMVTGGSTTTNYGTSTYTTKIGYGVMDAGGVGLEGQIFKVGFWNRALAGAEVANLAGGFVEYDASQNGLLAGFNFSEGTGTTLSSVGSSAVNASITAASMWTDPSTYSWTSTGGFTSSSKNLTGLTPRTYNLNISLKNCSRTTSFTVNATNTVPSVTNQPSSSAICAGTNTSFSVAGAGTGVSYKWQWRANSSGTFADLSNGGVYTNVTTATMNITGATVAMNGFQYQAVVSGTCTPAANSDVVTLTVNPNLVASVSISPSPSTTICAGTSVTFTAIPTNQGTAPTYQWKLNGTDVGTNSTTYTTTGLANGDQVTCVLTSNATPCLTGSSATSNTVTMTVNPNPTANAGGSLAAICPGATSAQMGGSVGGGATGGTWEGGSGSWSNASNPSTATYTAGPSESGNITLTLKTSGGSCGTISVTKTITVNPKETAPSIGTITDVSCLGAGSVILENLPSGTWYIVRTGLTTPQDSFSGTGTSRTITGLAADTYHFTIRTDDTCVSAQSSAVEIKDGSSTTWNGSIWSNGPPTSSKSVTISSTNGNPFTTDTEACSLIINVPNGTNDPFVTVPEGVTLTITNAVTSNGKLLFESGASLIQNTTVQNSGEIVYRRKASVRRYDFTYWSMPVTKAGFKMKNLSPNTLADKYFYFDTAVGNWALDYNGEMDMLTGIGYNIRAPQDHDLTIASDFIGQFTGIPNNGNIPTAVASGKWNMIGNPYPSAIDADQFLAENDGVGALYFWAHANLPVNDGTDIYYRYKDDFVTYNDLGTAGPAPFDGYIAATQGFIIKAPTATINFNNGQRRSGNNTKFFKTAKTTTEKHRLWLNFSNAAGDVKQILVGYAQGATNSIDTNFDATSMAASGSIDFYSINSSKKLVIQGRAWPFVKTDVVTFGYMAASKGDYTISINKADGIFNEDQEVFLHDKTTGKMTNLRLENYKFTSEAGTFNSRFVIRYVNTTLGTDDFENLENSVLVSVKDRIIKITSSQESIKEVNIFNIGAQLLYNKNNVNSSELQISNLYSSDQALLVKITLDNGHSFTKKIIFSNL